MAQDPPGGVAPRRIWAVRDLRLRVLPRAHITWNAQDRCGDVATGWHFVSAGTEYVQHNCHSPRRPCSNSSSKARPCAFSCRCLHLRCVGTCCCTDSAVKMLLFGSAAYHGCSPMHLMLQRTSIVALLSAVLVSAHRCAHSPCCFPLVATLSLPRSLFCGWWAATSVIGARVHWRGPTAVADRGHGDCHT